MQDGLHKASRGRRGLPGKGRWILHGSCCRIRGRNGRGRGRLLSTRRLGVAVLKCASGSPPCVNEWDIKVTIDSPNKRRRRRDGRGLDESLAELRETFRSRKTRSAQWRRSQLKALLRFVQEDEEEICRVLEEDLGKPGGESFRDEVNFRSLICNVLLFKSMLHVRVPLMAFPTTAELVPEPLGLVLIFSSWNFPMRNTSDLCSPGLGSTRGSHRRGNTVVLKPSEHAPSTSSFIAKKIPMYLDSAAVKVFEGGEEVESCSCRRNGITSSLLVRRWGYHSPQKTFRRSQKVGSYIMAAAAKNLTPVTLELGGKCPAILDSLSSKRDRDIAVRRITNAKWGVCGGQVCIGVDYLLVEEKSVEDQGLLRDDPQRTGSMSRIVNKYHFNRLRRLLEEPGVATSIVHGGFMDESNLYIEPTILLNPPLESEIMKEEIFGPLLPIITVKKIEDSIDFVNSRPKPLAAYAFTNDSALKKRIVSETSSGSLTFNDAIVQFLVDTLPFGGVGQSGFGRYHGKFSFDTFSHEKAVLRRNFLLEFSFGFPPWDSHKIETLRSAYNYDYLNLVLRLLG
ncbi:unnamed protein product [Spirodela intermedia]|uniref:Aldehyde dehydrogenase domain-containing protein n=1 Tax=Spirodela intermedia TaxID=51605 RepID=A0A7I8IIJ7_SPIIN|nr:unnamed protein product [Spirodela intermedia]CAA6656985.1 unnamed protein product [Spirodela intermedia]